jgi:hypothetical protein
MPADGLDVGDADAGDALGKDPATTPPSFRLFIVYLLVNDRF